MKENLLSLLLIPIISLHIYSKDGFKDKYIFAPFSNITNHSFVFNPDLNFAIPNNYLIVPDSKNISNTFLLHPDDLLAINKNGGDISSTNFKYSSYKILASSRFYYSKGSFSLEKKSGTLNALRIDAKGFPILKVEGKFSNGNKLNLILIHPNYVTWVIELWHYPPSHINNSNWKTLISGLSEKSINLPKSSLRFKTFSPKFPDSDKFTKDVYYNKGAEPLVYPFEFPVTNKTTENELYKLYSSKNITRRFSLPDPIEWSLGDSTFKFDTYIEYAVKGEVLENKSPGVYSTQTLGYYTYNIFLLNEVVTKYLFYHKVRNKNTGFKKGPNNVTKERLVSDFKSMRLKYLRSRSSLFRKIVANEWFYEDYLALGIEKRKKIKTLRFDYLTQFPDHLYKFLNLIKLDLSDSKISRIDCKSLKKLNYLEVIDLSGNNIESIPECINRLPNLKRLTLEKNPLNTISSELLTNESIQELDLTATNIKLSNQKRPSWKKLTQINLSRNHIKAIPKSWQFLESLEYINLSDNSYQGTPKNLYLLKKLKYIFLENSKIKIFPEKLLENKNLIRLDLSNNLITVLPESLCKKKKYSNGKPVIFLPQNPLSKANLAKIHKCNVSYSIFPKSILN